MLNITDCKNISDICRKQGWVPTGGNRRKVIRLLKKEGFDIDNWLSTIKQEHVKFEKQNRVTDNHNKLVNQIYKLRDEGKTYEQISQEVHCAKSTVSYWCSKRVRALTKYRKENTEDWINKLVRNICYFKKRPSYYFNRTWNEDWVAKLRKATSTFCKYGNVKNWGYNNIIQKFGTKTKCYLTGREIDLTKDDYNLDHIIPVSKGGSGNIDNLGITIPEANRSKTDLTLEEYLNLCEEVLRYHGRIK